MQVHLKKTKQGEEKLEPKVRKYGLDKASGTPKSHPESKLMTRCHPKSKLMPRPHPESNLMPRSHLKSKLTPRHHLESKLTLRRHPTFKQCLGFTLLGFSRLDVSKNP